MAGVKSFNIEGAYSRALTYFWIYGYKRASLHELLKVLGVSRSSFYNAFGDKHSLFLHVFQEYLVEVLEKPLDHALNKPTSGLTEIHAIFEQTAEILAVDADCKGCMMVNAMIDVAPTDTEIAQMIKYTIRKMEASFEIALENARAQGQIRSDIDVAATAKFLMMTLNGLRAMGRLPHSRDEYHVLINVALSILNVF